MLKGFFVVVLVCLGISCFASAKININIDGVEGKVSLVPGSVSRNVKLANSNSDAENKQYCLTASIKLNNLKRWRKYYFSFTPNEDGVVEIHLNALVKNGKAKKKKPCLWAAYDNITITGIEAENCDFETLNKEKLFAGWHNHKINMVTDSRRAKSGRNYIIVSDKDPVSQKLELKKGRQVTIIFYAKAVKGPA